MGTSRVHVVVAGGGLAGLAAALFLGRHGCRVTLLERDAAAPQGPPAAVFADWSRPGVPQFRQPHNFLGLSVRALRQEAPDVLEALVSGGVMRVPVDLGDGPDDALLCARRPVFEGIIRRSVEMEPWVEMRSGVTVADLLLRPGAAPIVEGLVTEDGETIRGDLFVDATGRRSTLSALLTARGARSPETSGQQCGLLYISRYYRLRPGRDFPCHESPVIADLGWARSMAFPADNGTFALLTTIAVIDPLRAYLKSEAGFARFHGSVPRIAPWVAAGEPISELRSMGFVENRVRRLVDADGPIAANVVLVGDAAFHSNPTAGRGTSLALAAAQHLALRLDRAADPVAYALEFDRWTADNVLVWYGPQATADAALAARMEAAIRGDPPQTLDHAAFSATVSIARTDTPVARTVRRMVQLVAPPDVVLGDAGVQAAIEALFTTHPELAEPAEGPTREEIALA